MSILIARWDECFEDANFTGQEEAGLVAGAAVARRHAGPADAGGILLHGRRACGGGGIRETRCTVEQPPQQHKAVLSTGLEVARGRGPASSRLHSPLGEEEQRLIGQVWAGLKKVWLSM